MADIFSYLRKLDEMVLEELIGRTVVRATSQIIDTDRSEDLARMLELMGGEHILSITGVRDAIINGLSPQQAQNICIHLNINDGTNPFNALTKYFATYTETKSEKLVEILALPKRYIKTKLPDERQDKEIIQNIHGEKAQRYYLHDYQKKIKDRALKKVLNQEQRFMVHMPTGSGKTATALELAVDIFRTPYQKKYITWIVNSETLAEQAFQTFKELWGQKGDQEILAYRFFNEFSPDFPSDRSGFVCANFQKFWSSLDPTSSNYKKALALIENTSILIVDEAHTSTAETFYSVIDKFVSKNPPSQLIGLSATPARQETEQNTALRYLYGSTLVGIQGQSGQDIPNAIQYLQSGGYLAQIHLEPIDTNIDCNQITEAETCAELAQNNERNRLILEQMQNAKALNEPTLVFSCTKDHVFALTALANHAGIKTELIVGETQPSVRQRILDDFKSGKILFIINHEILATGVDVPNVRRLIITRPVGSPVLYSQIIGRALRGPKNGGGDKENTVISYRDNISNYDSEATLFNEFIDRFFES